MSNLMLEKALAYFYRGWSIIPLRHHGKKPLVDWKQYQARHSSEDELRAWWLNWPDANIGIVTGAISGIVVLDSDGPDGWASICQQGGTTETLTASTAKGAHLYFKHPGFEVRNFTRKLPELDFRGDGGYIVAPPSIHPSGAVYAWRTELAITQIAEVPSWILNLVKDDDPLSVKSNDRTLGLDTITLPGSVSSPYDVAIASLDRFAVDNTAGDYWLQRALTRGQVGKRNVVGFWLACQLRDQGVGQSIAEMYLEEYQLRVPQYVGDFFTLSEALASVKEAYARPARLPASHTNQRSEQQQANTSPISPVQTSGSNGAAPPPSVPPPPAEPPQGNSGSMGGGGPQMVRPANYPGLIRLLADTIARQASFTRDSGNLLYIYRNGVYIPDASQYIKQEIKRLLVDWDQSARWNKNLVDQVEAYIAADIGVLWEQPPMTMINLMNGWLHLETGVLHPHHPVYHTTVQLPIHYDPNADCPAWNRFLAEVLPPDVYAADIVWQLLALLMLPYTDAHQAVLLSGPGGNGKGALLAAIRAFLGTRNVSSLNLDQITGQRFEAAKLFGKLANICDDLSSKQLGDTSIFKMVVSGDPITADRKYRDSITFSPFARLLFSSNEYPQSGDSSSGFYDRWVVIPFTNEFRGQHGEISRRLLDAELCKPEELSGVLNQALAALPSILNQRLLMTDSMRSAWDEFCSTTDWVMVWCERMLVDHASGVIEKKALHQALLTEAHRLRHAVIQPGAFYKKIRTRWPNVTEAQRRLDPTRNGVDCFIGLAWRTGIPPI